MYPLSGNELVVVVVVVLVLLALAALAPALWPVGYLKTRSRRK